MAVAGWPCVGEEWVRGFGAGLQEGVQPLLTPSLPQGMMDEGKSNRRFEGIVTFRLVQSTILSIRAREEPSGFFLLVFAMTMRESAMKTSTAR